MTWWLKEAIRLLLKFETLVEEDGRDSHLCEYTGNDREQVKKQLIRHLGNHP